MITLYNKSNLLVQSIQNLNKLKSCLLPYHNHHHLFCNQSKRHFIFITTSDKIKKDFASASSSSENPEPYEIPINNINKQEPQKCSEAIKIGLDLFKSEKYKEALNIFGKALELPGNGAYRLPGRAKEFSCPSEDEERVAIYNIACCYAKMNEKASCLTVIKGLLEHGYDDFETLINDEDLELVRRGKELYELIAEYNTIQSKIRKKLTMKNNEKPWLLW